jgi:hypothetical protein
LQEDEDEQMVYGAKHIIMLFIPVSICMLIVVVNVAFLNIFKSSALQRAK